MPVLLAPITLRAAGSGAADQGVIRSDVDASRVGDAIDAGRVGANEVTLNQTVRAALDENTD